MRIIQSGGAAAIIKLSDPTWFRDRTTWPIDCPDGVTRTVTFPNWKWCVWNRPPGANPFRRYVHDAWQLSQLTHYHDASAVLTEQLAYDMDMFHRRAAFWPSNNNRGPSLFEPDYRPRLRWGRGGVRSVFRRHA